MKRIVPISEHDHWSDYAEFNVLDDQERFARTQPRPLMQINFAMIGVWLFGASLWIGVAWILVWLYTDGHRHFNHFLQGLKF